MNHASTQLAELETPIPSTKINEIAEIYKSSTLLLNVCISIKVYHNNVN
ncbi:unnamed protein product, partial [Rotaria sp. Silwood1]